MQKHIRKGVKLEVKTDSGTIEIEHDNTHYNASQLGDIVNKSAEKWIDLEFTYKLINTIQHILKEQKRTEERVYFYKHANIWIHNLILKDFAKWLGEPVLSAVSKHLRHVKHHPANYRLHKKNIDKDQIDRLSRSPGLYSLETKNNKDTEHIPVLDMAQLQIEQTNGIKQLQSDLKQLRHDVDELYARDVCQRLCVLV